MSGAIASIALHLRPDMPYLMHDVALVLKARLGCQIHAYVSSKDQLDFYQAQNESGAYLSITVQRYPLQAIDDVLPPEAELVATARQNEAWLGLTYNLLAVGNRHFGRGFSLLGSGHSRSRYFQASDYRHLLHGYNQFFRFWKQETESKNLNLFLGGPSELTKFARACGLPFRGLFGSRHKSYHYWGLDEFQSSPALETRYSTLVAKNEEGEVMTEPYTLAKQYGRRAKASAAFARMAKDILVKSLKVMKWRALGFEKGRGYFLRDDIAYFLRYRRDWRLLTGPATRKNADLEGRPFVFFPLQTEPETSIHVRSPEHFFQHEAIVSLARDLPAGWRLAVKETPFGVGRRPDGFYERLQALKNVVLLNIEERGFDVIGGATAVATIVGTAGFEAAALGKPVISFGCHNIYNFLPHVFVVKDNTRLREQLALALVDQFDHAAAALAGRRFVRAVTETSFDLGAHVYQRKNVHTAEEIRSCVDGLLATL
jgi:hypothetical protein